MKVDCARARLIMVAFIAAWLSIGELCHGFGDLGFELFFGRSMGDLKKSDCDQATGAGNRAKLGTRASFSRLEGSAANADLQSLRRHQGPGHAGR